ncbi:hypothetical protein AMQ68_10985 [Chryseobacterium sp. ERMR1:04]|nr:hypothetical protein AMQ68_10985 [Chryseobacterium sp. ERMR1:04]
MFKIDRSQHLCINPDEREKHKAKKNKFHQLESFLENGKYQFIVHKNKKILKIISGFLIIYLMMLSRFTLVS